MLFWWVGLAGTEYHGQHPLLSLTTAGWFYLGLPMTLGMSIAFGCIVALLARKSWVWCTVAFSIVLVLTGTEAYFKLPSIQLRHLIGEDAARAATIEVFRVHDTMNAGEFTSGILSGPIDLAQRIAEQRKMQRGDGPLHRFQQSFPTASFPDYGRLWTDDRMMMYSDDATGRLYFLEDGLQADGE